MSSETAVPQAADTSVKEDATGTITARQAAALLQFLQRAQLQGAEMPAYVDVFNTLSGIVAEAQADAA